jgi:parallel beta-helix repeat protein
MSKFRVILLFLALFLVPSLAPGMVIKSGTTWSGEISVAEDILVPEGVTLTVAPGTVIRISPAEGTKTDPEFMSPLTEIIIRGTLVADGKEGSPVTFLISGEKKSTWAGIIIDGGNAVLRYCIIRDAEAGLEVMRGSVAMTDTLLTENRYGLTVHGHGRDVRVEGENNRVQRNDYGVILLNGASIEGKGNEVSENRKKDTYSAMAKEYYPLRKEYKGEQKDTVRVYGDEALLGITVWQKRIEVRGILRVPEGSRLLIMPGTIVEFGRKDTNNDGIGENGILIQGVIIAKGTPENPIIFRSAEKQRRMGDWDSINIMNSDRAQNLIEYCQIEDAYRGLHFHFSNVAVTNAVIRNNYRGVQFQESIVEIRGTIFYGNKNALQARDSEIIFSDNALYQNYSGMNVFRTTIAIRNNWFLNNDQEGLRVREGVPVVEGNLLDGNRHGLMVNGTVYGTFSSNVISHNLESGIALKGTDNLEINGNVIQQNGINGITIQDSSAVIQGNLISDNRERGIGVLSFQGVITGNNILRNALYNLGIEGEEDVSAPMNWWGDGDVRNTIYDKENDPARGRADYLPVRNGPVLVAWPVKTVAADALWHGDIQVNDSVTVQPGINLIVSPGAKVLFSKGAGLAVKGKIVARGEKDARITFAFREGGGAGRWDEILLDHAVGSAFMNCTFADATWALHSHFTDLKVEGCAFLNNYGGIRFTSGPIEVKRSLFRDNEIGIRAFRGRAEITENVFTGNRIGIFVREKGGGLTIRRNNLFANSEYNLRLGDFNDEDVDARDNWWGDAAPTDTIFDDRKDPGIGRVNFEPYVKHPFRTEFPAGVPDEKENKMKTGFGAEAK